MKYQISRSAILVDQKAYKTLIFLSKNGIERVCPLYSNASVEVNTDIWSQIFDFAKDETKKEPLNELFATLNVDLDYLVEIATMLHRANID